MCRCSKTTMLNGTWELCINGKRCPYEWMPDQQEQPLELPAVDGLLPDPVADWVLTWKAFLLKTPPSALFRFTLN